MRHVFYGVFGVAFVLIGGLSLIWKPVLWFLIIVIPLFLLGVYDSVQTKHAVRRNFPIIGHFRYLFEAIRPEINQYFVESDTDGRPFNREIRSVIYQRAKHVLDTVPFGTKGDVYAIGYEWLNHSLACKEVPKDPPRVAIGEETCAQPYRAALLNISAMSFGSLSKNAIRALNGGAKLGGFAHNTGEGGASRYHLEPGGDVIWQIGTGYFGCRDADGRFSLEKFSRQASHKNIKMIEIKLSQGAKPGHGGILPAAKLTEEIATIRGVPMGRDVLSPPSHSAFSTPLEMMAFIAMLREASGGKPVGIKLCVGKRREFLAMCKAMVESGQHPDYVAVDGGEGGTGAAPLEFTRSVGTPLDEGLVFVHNALVGFNLRDRIKVIAGGRITTGFDMVARIAMGADLCYSARGMMMALGCIQALRCNSNHCPVGVATQDPGLTKGLVVEDKMHRVAGFQRETVESMLELVAAAGLNHPHELRPWHIQRRISHTEVKHYSELFPYLKPGELLHEPFHPAYARALRAARADSFDAAVRDDGGVAFRRNPHGDA